MARRTHALLRCALVATLACMAGPIVVSSTLGDAQAAPKKTEKDPLADRFAGQVLFLRTVPPAIVGGPGWFAANRIDKQDENSDKKWPLKVMVFLRRPLDAPALDLMVTKIDKKGGMTMIQKFEQFPQGDGRSFLFHVTPRKGTDFEPNLKFIFRAVSNGATVAEGTIELNGKEERVGGENLDFTGGVDLSKPKEEAPTSPFSAAATKEALKKVIFEQCKTASSKGGKASMELTFAGKDGKVLRLSFVNSPNGEPPPYSDATQNCIIRQFERAKTKPFSGKVTHTVRYHITLDD